MITATTLAKTYPWIDWRKPVPMVIGTKCGFGCRICIAQVGYKPSQGQLPGFNEKEEEVVKHLAEAHND